MAVIVNAIRLGWKNSRLSRPSAAAGPQSSQPALQSPRRSFVRLTTLALLASSALLADSRAAIAQTTTKPKPAAAALAVSAEPTEHIVEVLENVQYGTAAGEPLTLHLYKPATGGPYPVILYIHGGGWAAGNKNDLAAEAKAHAAAGFVTATIGYRLVPKHLYPACIEDVKCAVRWMRAHATEHRAQADKIGAIGFSAGAHLAMLLGTMGTGDGLEGTGGWPDQSSQVQAVVAYFGPTNFESELPDLSRPIAERFFSGTKTEKPNEYKLASPIHYVSNGDAPTLIFHGTDDALVPYDQAIQMVHAMHKAKVAGRIELMINAGHGWGGTELQRTRTAGREFFVEHLQPKK